LGNRRWTALLLYVVIGLATTSRGSIELIFPLNLNHLGISLPLIGTTVALLGLGQLTSRVPGGAVYRAQRARALISAALVLMGLSSAGLALGGIWGLQAALGAVYGLAYGLASTFLLATLIDSQPDGANAASTMAWFTAAISAGFALGAPLGAQAIIRLGYGGAFWVPAAVAIVAAMLSLVLTQPPARKATVAETSERSAGPRLRIWRAPADFPAAVWLATLLVFYISLMSETVNIFFPIYAVRVGIGLAIVGLLKSINSLVATGIRFASAGLFRFVNAGLINHLCVLAMAAAAVALPVFTDQLALVAIFVVLGLTRGLIRVTTATAVAEERGSLGPRVGMASGIYNAGLDAGSMLAPPASGAVAGAIGIPNTFWVVGIALPLAYYLVWFGQRARRSRQVTRPRQPSLAPAIPRTPWSDSEG